MTEVFTRTNEQRLAALEQANQTRVERAKMKRRLKTGTLNIIDVVEDPPGYAMSMKAHALLCCVPKVGPLKAGRILNRARVSTAKTLGGLSDRQREQLASDLRQLGFGR